MCRIGGPRHDFKYITGKVNQMFDKEETLSEKIYFYDADKKSIGAYEF